MKKYLGQVYIEHKNFWDKKLAFSLFRAFIFLVIALILQKFAENYLSKINGSPTSDLFLSNIRTFDLDIFVVQGALILTLLIIFLTLTKPKYILFLIKSLSLFVIIRSFFISLTHLGISPNVLILDQNSLGFSIYDLLFNSKKDFFFSGHTGIPFLMGLIFWKEKYWRYLFFAISATLGTCVLLAHIHYSIDVFAAPFMTYAIYVVSQKIFIKDYKLIS